MGKLWVSAVKIKCRVIFFTPKRDAWTGLLATSIGVFQPFTPLEEKKILSGKILHCKNKEKSWKQNDTVRKYFIAKIKKKVK